MCEITMHKLYNFLLKAEIIRFCLFWFQIFNLLWKLIQNDILFVWERVEFLQHDNDEILCEVPFKVTQFNGVVLLSDLFPLKLQQFLVGVFSM